MPNDGENSRKNHLYVDRKKKNGRWVYNYGQGWTNKRTPIPTTIDYSHDGPGESFNPNTFENNHDGEDISNQMNKAFNINPVDVGMYKAKSLVKDLGDTVVSAIGSVSNTVMSFVNGILKR